MVARSVRAELATLCDMDRRARLQRARLYFVADRAGMQRALEPALVGGVDLFQLRDKEADDHELVSAADQARTLCHQHDALFLLNDRPDLSVAAGADGVHVGQEDEPVFQARQRVGPDALVGLSTHSIKQAQAGSRSGADYIAVGPVNATPTKEGRPAIGLEPIDYAAHHVAVPWFAIGGLESGNLDGVVQAGARRIVVVRAIADAEDPEAVARTLRRQLERSRR